MPITITLRATTTVDGVVHEANGTCVLQARSMTRQTRDITNTFAQIASPTNGYYIILNHGDESAFVKLVSTGSDRLVFQVTPGAHLVIPTSVDNGASFSILQVDARSATSAGTRIGIITIDTGL